MKNVLLSMLSFTVFGCASMQATQDAPPETARSNRVSLLVGERSLRSSDWDPVDEHDVVAFEYVAPLSYQPLEFEVGIARSKDEHSSTDGTTTEGSFGIRTSFGTGDDRLQPYVGAGISRIEAEIDPPGNDDDDGSFAAYAHGGVLYYLSPEWFLGFDLRFLFGSDIDLFGEDMDADYTQFGILVGFAF